MKRTIIVAVMLVMSSASPLARAAQDCTAIEDPEARLACYDQQFSRASGAESDEGGEVAEQSVEDSVEEPVKAASAEPSAEKIASPTEEASPAPAAVISSETVAAEPEKTQTAAGESQEPAKGGLFDQDERVDLTSTITHVHARSQQKMVFQLENEQVWIQSVPRLLRISEGDQVTIENASVGGYMMRTNRGVTTRVERIR